MALPPQTAPAAPSPVAADADGRSPRRDAPALGALLLVVLAVNLAYVVGHGAVSGGDTPRYTDGADALLHGGGLSPRQALYSGYIAFIALFRVVGLGSTGVVVGQVVVMSAGTAAVYALARGLGGRTAGLLGGALFGLNPELVTWNAYLLPEATYVGWLAVALWLVERAASRRGRLAWAVIALIVLALLRPNGWIPALLAASYLVVRLLPSWRARVAAIAALAVAMAALAAALPAAHGDSDTLLPGRLLREGQVIWEYPPSYLAVAGDAGVRNDHWPGFVRYATRHPGDTARVLVARVAVEARQTRPYYSPAHNVMTAAVILVLYAGAAIGALLGRRVPLVWLMLLVVLAHLAVIAATIADYDGRFGRHYFGLLAVLAGYGWATVLGAALTRAGARTRF